MSEIARCFNCDYRVSEELVTLWDARTYCRKCVEEASPELYAFVSSGGQLHDTIDRDDISAMRCATHMWKWYLALVMLVFGLPSGIAVLVGKLDILGPVFLLAFFGGGGMLFVLLKALLGVRSLRSQLPRTVSVEDGQLIIQTPDDQESVPIKDCKWRFGSTYADEVCMYTGLRRGVVIQTPEEQIACGHTQDMLLHWRAFLSLARIPENPPLGCLRLLGVAGTGAVVGCLVGAGIGYAISIITNVNEWTTTLGFVGVIEGTVVALLYATCTSDGAVAARVRLHPMIVSLVFLLIGFAFVSGFGVLAGVLGGGMNALLGAVVALLCQQKINAAETQRELEQQLRP